MKTIRDFKKDTITEESIELMEPYLRMEDYNYNSAKQVCGNVAGLISWTISMTNFYAINKDVLPLRVILYFSYSQLKKNSIFLNNRQKIL